MLRDELPAVATSGALPSSSTPEHRRPAQVARGCAERGQPTAIGPRAASGPAASFAPAMRAPVDPTPAPPFPRDLGWVNVAMLRMDKLRGAPVLVEFFDPFRVHSLRTLPYVQEWARKYAGD